MLVHENGLIYCWAWQRVYVKANGRVPCWCDSGESHTIIHKDVGSHDFIRDIVNSPEMCQMRLTLLRQNKPYIKQCSTCCCMQDSNRGKHSRFTDQEQPDFLGKTIQSANGQLDRVVARRKWSLGSIDRIAEIQLEPAFPCNLRCPGCLHGSHPAPLTVEPRPHFLPLDWFKRIIDSICYNAVSVNRINFVGRGEPTLNKDLPMMLKYAKECIPSLPMYMDTNSTQPWKDEYLNLSSINCSIDGSSAEPYSLYRRGGKFEATMSFIKQAATRKRALGSACVIRWKYILLETNDTEKDLNTAQQIAAEFDIDALDLVLTHCGAIDQSLLPSKQYKTSADVQAYIDNNKIFRHTVVSHAT